MIKIQGKAVCEGIATAKIFYYKQNNEMVEKKSIHDVSFEINRYQQAKLIAKEQFHGLYEKTITEIGEKEASIFEVYTMLIDDENFDQSIRDAIETDKINAEYAVYQTGTQLAETFSLMDDEYMKGRALDIKDISYRLISILSGEKSEFQLGSEPVIVMAKDLSPSETVQFDKSKLAAIVTENGSANSHSAILAKTMGIPALIGVKTDEDWNGKNAIVDGKTGVLYIEPDEETLRKMENQSKINQDEREQLLGLKKKETVTKDGRKINLYANIGSDTDLSAVLESDAEGIGLFRSEFLYLEKTTFPTEEELFQSYKKVAEAMAGKKVVIRTLDIGADKQASYFGLKKEENPAMGLRAIRICLQKPELFKTQLRAIFRAAYYGNVSIMYPMIISVEEIIEIKNIAAEVVMELENEGANYRVPEQGIMIETPAAVMVSDELAKHVDFFSIGTNDLTQYTLAVDRQDESLGAFYNPHHRAILKMIQTVIGNAHKENIWVGICGELAADTDLTETFINMGIDELSVAPSMVLKIRKKIRDINAMANAKLSLAAIFKDGMILQRNSTVCVFGESDCETIKLEFANQTYTCPVTDNSWAVEFLVGDSKENFTMTVSAMSNDIIEAQIVIRDILLGEVWILGGQSNMELELQNSENGHLVVSMADDPLIRYYITPKYAFCDEQLLQMENESRWRCAVLDDANEISAIGYYFAKKLRKELDCPIGLVGCYMGGTSATCWVSKEALKEIKEVQPFLQEWEKAITEKSDPEYEADMKAYDDACIDFSDRQAAYLQEHPNSTATELAEATGFFPWPPPKGRKSLYQPYALYENMYKRINRFSVKGILYYQAEEDNERAEYYHKLNTAVIKQWRKNDDTPFYMAQLPMYTETANEENIHWVTLRSEQELCAKENENTYLIPLPDCGEKDNIHPTNKKIPGERFAKMVLENTYGIDIKSRPMRCGHVSYDGNVCSIQMVDAYGGILYKDLNDDGRILGFEISYNGTDFEQIDSVIPFGDTVEIFGQEGKEIVAVRYAWFNYGAANIYNREANPLVPFFSKKDS